MIRSLLGDALLLVVGAVSFLVLASWIWWPRASGAA